MSEPLVCSSGVELLGDYLEDVLPIEVRDRIEAHVSGCPRCQAFVASYRATPQMLREATLASLPAELEGSLLRFLRDQR